MRVPGKKSATKPEAQRQRYAAPKPTVDALLATERNFNKTGIEFLKIDLETGLAFSRAAIERRIPPSETVTADPHAEPTTRCRG